jgi:hypothetical protein
MMQSNRIELAPAPAGDPRSGTGAPISAEKCCVIYQVNGEDRRSPWFYSLERGERALAILDDRYGRAILFRDRRRERYGRDRTRN